MSLSIYCSCEKERTRGEGNSRYSSGDVKRILKRVARGFLRPSPSATSIVRANRCSVGERRDAISRWRSATLRRRTSLAGLAFFFWGGWVAKLTDNQEHLFFQVGFREGCACPRLRCLGNPAAHHLLHRSESKQPAMRTGDENDWTS